MQRIPNLMEMKLSGNKKELSVVIALLVFFLLAAIMVIFNTHNSFGGGDHFSHFKLARWGWKYPKLLLDEWGKPVFTLLVSPFAQLGINFARMYNVLMGILTAFFAWKLSQTLKFDNNWVIILLVLFTPIYFISMFAVLTEVTFSMLLVLSLLLFFQKKYIWSAVVISFLPLARTESIVLFPLFLLAFGMKKQVKALPFLVTGFLFFSLLGWPFYHHFWWLITEMPYKGGTSGLYGHGKLLHFVEQTPHILGYPLAFLFCAGFFYDFWAWGKKEHFRLSERFFFLLLVPGSYLLYLAAHSYVWWKGIGNSLGLIRVMAAVTPLAALTSLSGYNFLLKLPGKQQLVVRIVATLVLLWIVYTGTFMYQSNFKRSPAERLLAKACQYIKQHHLTRYKIYYFSNFVPIQLGIDPFDPGLSSEGVPHNKPVSKAIPNNSIIVWDAHFGPNEGKTPLSLLTKDSGLQILNSYKPKVPFKVLGGYDYAVYIFQKKRGTSGTEHFKWHNGFENRQDKKGSHYTSEKAHTGKWSLKMDSSIRFSPCFELPLNSLVGQGSTEIRASVWVYPVHPVTETPASLVVSFQHGNTAYDYHAYNLEDPQNSSKLRINHWNKVAVHYPIPKNRRNSDIVKVYLWYRGKKEIYFDDLEVSFLGDSGGSPSENTYSVLFLNKKQLNEKTSGYMEYPAGAGCRGLVRF
jgi:hypothetical protein